MHTVSLYKGIKVTKYQAYIVEDDRKYKYRISPVKSSPWSLILFVQPCI